MSEEAKSINQLNSRIDALETLFNDELANFKLPATDNTEASQDEPKQKNSMSPSSPSKGSDDLDLNKARLVSAEDSEDSLGSSSVNSLKKSSGKSSPKPTGKVTEKSAGKPGGKSAGRSTTKSLGCHSSDEDVEEFFTKLSHIKCQVVKLVQKQIENLTDPAFQEKIKCGNTTLREKLWAQRWNLLGLLLLLLLMWLLFVYGAILGASICKGGAGGCSNSHTGCSHFSGLHLARSTQMVF